MLKVRSKISRKNYFKEKQNEKVSDNNNNCHHDTIGVRIRAAGQ